MNMIGLKNLSKIGLNKLKSKKELQNKTQIKIIKKIFIRRFLKSSMKIKRQTSKNLNLKTFHKGQFKLL